jgi:hypothetical protein
MRSVTTRTRKHLHPPKKSALLRPAISSAAQKQHQNDESQNPNNRLKRSGAHD